LETSFCGYQDPRNPLKTIPYTIGDMAQLGQDLLLSFLEFNLLMEKCAFDD